MPGKPAKSPRAVALAGGDPRNFAAGLDLIGTITGGLRARLRAGAHPELSLSAYAGG